MSYVRGSESDPTDMNSIERWFYDGPQSNVHDRLISGTSPQAQQVDPASARISQDLFEHVLHSPQTDSKQCTSNGTGRSAENVPARSTRPISGKPQAVPKRSSTAPTFTSRLGEKFSGNLIHHFKTWFSNTRLVGASEHEPGASTSEVLGEICETNGPSSVKRIRKRLGGLHGPNKSDSEEDKRTARAKKSKTSASVEKPRFACPFYQRHPGNHRPSRACSGSGFDTMHHLKQHLERCHRGGVGAEQVTDEQWETLQNMRQLVCKKGRKEKWETLYELLFPEDATIPCHYRHPKGTEMCQVGASPSHPSSDQKGSWNDLTGFTRFVSWKGPDHVTKQLNTNDCSSSTAETHAERTRFAAMFPDLVAGLARLYLEEKGGSALNVEENPTRPINEGSAAIEGYGLEDPSANHFIPVPQARSVPPHLPQFPQPEPLGDSFLGFDPFLGYQQLPTCRQDARTDISTRPTGNDHGFCAEESARTSPNDYVQPPTDFVSPQALQVDESDTPTAYTPVFSNCQQSDPEQGGGGSFTTAPPKDSNNQEKFDVSLVGTILQDVPDIEGDSPFSFSYSPEIDVGAVGMDEDRWLYTRPMEVPENIPPHEMNA